MKSHSNVDDDVCVELCWIVLHTINAKPTTSATAEKIRFLFFNAQRRRRRHHDIRIYMYNVNTLSYLFGFETVRKPNEVEEEKKASEW